MQPDGLVKHDLPSSESMSCDPERQAVLGDDKVSLGKSWGVEKVSNF